MKPKKVLLIGILALYLSAIPSYADVSTNYKIISKENGIIEAEVDIKGGEESALLGAYSKNIIFLLDVSGSMATLYGNKSRLDWGKEAIVSLVSNLDPKSKIGVVTFSQATTIQVPLTFDRDNFINRVKALEVSERAQTNIAQGIIDAANLLNKERKSLPIIIILTDGKQTKGIGIDPLEAAKYASEKNIVIYSAGIGEKSEIDEEVLNKIASITGGQYSHVSDLSQLVNTLNNFINIEIYLSAVGLNLEIIQTKDAIIDYYSPEVLTSPDTPLITKNKFNYISPKLEKDQKISLRFKAIATKEGNIDLGEIKITYLTPDGEEKQDTMKIKTEIPVSQEGMWLFIFGISALIAVITSGILLYKYQALKGNIKNDALDLENKLKINEDRPVKEISDLIINNYLYKYK